MRFITPQDIEKKLVELEEGVKKERIAMNELNFIVTQMIFDYGQKPQKPSYLPSICVATQQSAPIAPYR